MQIAYLVAQESKCVSHKVGALIVVDGRIISTGYNGTQSGSCNCNDHAKTKGWLLADDQHLNQKFRMEHNEWSKKNEIHAELNSILWAARNGKSIMGGTMYVTISPCSECSKALAQSGIKRLVYCEAYDKNPEDWDELLSKQVKIDKVEATSLKHIDMTTIFKAIP